MEGIPYTCNLSLLLLSFYLVLKRSMPVKTVQIEQEEVYRFLGRLQPTTLLTAVEGLVNQILKGIMRDFIDYNPQLTNCSHLESSQHKTWKKKQVQEAGPTAQKLRVLCTVTVVSSVPKTHIRWVMSALNSILMESDAFFQPSWAPMLLHTPKYTPTDTQN